MTKISGSEEKEKTVASEAVKDEGIEDEIAKIEEAHERTVLRQRLYDLEGE